MNALKTFASLIAPVLVGLSLGACDSDSAAIDPRDEVRGPLGKSDAAEGTCVGADGDLCGEITATGCACDELCVQFGDCCHDAGPVCDIDVPAQEPKVRTCGGIVGFLCPDGLTCIDDPADSCDPANGGFDCLGICVEPQPQPMLCGGIGGFLCPEGMTCAIDPTVCDPNDGGRDCAGTCVPEAQFCGGIGGLPCPEGKTCVLSTENCQFDCGGVCVDF